MKRSDLLDIALNGEQTRRDKAVRIGENIGRAGRLSAEDIDAVPRVGQAWPTVIETALHERQRLIPAKSGWQIALEGHLERLFGLLAAWSTTVRAGVWCLLVMTIAFDFIGWLR